MNIPSLQSVDLAYETGVHIGDGCLQDFGRGNYRYTISGSRKNEQAYYREVLSPLLAALYNVRPSVLEWGTSIFIYVYSKELLTFKHVAMGMPVGKKDQLRSLPDFVDTAPDEWVGQIIAGMCDADGCVKLRRTSSGAYPRITFAQRTKGVVADVKRLLSSRFNITSTLYQCSYYDRRYGVVERVWHLDINGFHNFRLFMKCIGTRSPYVMSRITGFGLVSDVSRDQSLQTLIPNPLGALALPRR